MADLELTDAAPGRVDPRFWRGKRVSVTGHTGFKGAWLTLWLAQMGARVTGLANGVPTAPALFEEARVGELVETVTVDIRDFDRLAPALARAQPEIVIHMAAQSLVRRSYREPRETYETNVIGTVNVLEAVRADPGVRLLVNVTSDKCYENDGRTSGYREHEPMGGHDPYSSSKGCSELMTAAWRRSFFSDPDGARLATARAGNVIGGGDWSEDRLIADLMRAALAQTPVSIRNPKAVRPWQHVLNPLSGYLVLAQRLWDDPTLADGWNFGPDPDDARPVSWIADRVAQEWPGRLHWQADGGEHPHEAQHLNLDSSKAHSRLRWRPTWGLGEALARTVAWYQAYGSGTDVRATTIEQIDAFKATRCGDFASATGTGTAP